MSKAKIKKENKSKTVELSDDELDTPLPLWFVHAS